MMLVVRGDLQSETGWSKATRALVRSIADNFDAVAGVDLHFNTTRSETKFCGGIVSENVAMTLASHKPDNVILHAVLPNQIMRYPKNLNFGWWFWETDVLPSNSDWIERINSLDHLFVPSPWQAEVLKRLNLRIPVSVVPWPHWELDLEETPGAVPSSERQNVLLYSPWSKDVYEKTLSIDHMFGDKNTNHRKKKELVQNKLYLLNSQRTDIQTVLKKYDRYYFAVQSDAPRKGLPALISEWCRYCRENSRSSALLIRFSCLNVNYDKTVAMQRFTEIALNASRGAAGLSNVYVILDHLDDSDLTALYKGSVATISATYGEGFGGTIVEALQSGCIPISPRHTACAQLVPEGSVISYPSIPYVGKLIDQLPLQPASGSWHLPVPGAIAETMNLVECLSPDERSRTIKELRKHLKEALCPSKARLTIAKAIEHAVSEKNV